LTPCTASVLVARGAEEMLGYSEAEIADIAAAGAVT
jgi:hypothetical protein